MKKIIIVRHGESEPYSTSRGDHERQLTSVGIANAEKLRGYLSKIRVAVDLFYTSDAARTLQTSKIISAASNLPDQYESTGLLYGASLSQLIQFLSSQNDTKNCILVVGHNPTLSEGICELTGTHMFLKPGECVVLSSDLTSWSLVDTLSWTIESEFTL